MPRAGSKTIQITGYGEQADRDRLFLIAEAYGVSQSQWLVGQIRKTYDDLYGSEDPTSVIHRGGAAVLTDKDPPENDTHPS